MFYWSIIIIGIYIALMKRIMKANIKYALRKYLLNDATL
jgi:hypothetical protein